MNIFNNIINIINNINVLLLLFLLLYVKIINYNLIIFKIKYFIILK